MGSLHINDFLNIPYIKISNSTAHILVKLLSRQRKIFLPHPLSEGGCDNTHVIVGWKKRCSTAGCLVEDFSGMLEVYMSYLLGFLDPSVLTETLGRDSVI